MPEHLAVKFAVELLLDAVTFAFAAVPAHHEDPAPVEAPIASTSRWAIVLVVELIRTSFAEHPDKLLTNL